MQTHTRCPYCDTLVAVPIPGKLATCPACYRTFNLIVRADRPPEPTDLPREPINDYMEIDPSQCRTVQLPVLPYSKESAATLLERFERTQRTPIHIEDAPEGARCSKCDKGTAITSYTTRHGSVNACADHRNYAAQTLIALEPRV